MFDRGVSRLIDALPDIATLDASAVRRLLTDGYLGVVAQRDLAGAPGEGSDRPSQLRRLATALEVQAVLDSDLSTEARAACAFVAAEALEVHRELLAAGMTSDDVPSVGIPYTTYAAIEAASLYFVAGFDANAAVASRAITTELDGDELPEHRAARRALEAMKAFFELRELTSRASDESSSDQETTLADRVRSAVWARIEAALDQQLRWLLGGADAPAGLSDLADQLATAQRHADLHHLVRLLADAADAVGQRSLRALSPPDGDAAIWDSYVASRIAHRPLLWPAGEEYARRALPGPNNHAVVSVPTGAGKSAVAELGIAQALNKGWVLYLAPTNALVGQVMRDLNSRFATAEGVQVRAFLGGAEYTESEGEAVAGVEDRQVLVMTPEKCSLALRQAPEAFQRLRLVVFDECHLIGDYSTRSVVAELVVAELLERAPDAAVLLMSAMVSNGAELAAWLDAATGREAVSIDNPWRPTRTVRAVLGIDVERASEAVQPAVQTLEDKPNRKRVNFEAPVMVLANLQGAWATTDPGDYATLPSSLTAPLVLERTPNGPEVLRSGYVNEMSGRLAHHLASSGHRVLTFLPANKHYSFSVARDLEPLSARQRSGARVDVINALLDMAEYELGVESALRDLLAKAVAVHTSAMLRDEQLASEIAFIDSQAVAMFATGTLAQGLNLPASAVVVGGTHVGHEPGAPQHLQDERSRSQLLNAIGRAGRAYVASRSLGVVVPEKWVGVRADGSPSQARDRAPFLRYDDASTEIRSQLAPMIERALTAEGILVDQMSDAEETAFAMLSVPNQAEAQRIVRRSFGGYALGISADADRAERVAESLRTAGSIFMESTGMPAWASQAPNSAGTSLPATASLYAAVTPLLEETRPATLDAWLAHLIQGLASTPPRLTAQLVPEYPFRSTPASALFDEEADDEERRGAAHVLLRTVVAWMNGEPITDIAAVTLGETARADKRRGSGNPLPKMFSVLDTGVAFGLSRAAGVLAALARLGTDADEVPWACSDEERQLLNLLPLSIRFGCGSSMSLAWYRWGFRRRRIAHLLAAHVPPPDGLGGQDLQSWIGAQRRSLLLGEDPPEIDEEEASVLAALRRAERVM